MGRHQHRRVKPIGPTKAEKEQYLIEATAFASNVAEEMNEPEAEKLYCPVYRVKPCGCVQRFITGGDVGDFPSDAASKRVYDLLRLHREAKKLKSRIVTDSNDKGDKRLLRMLRAEGFERFILANRLQVRHEMGICERACQRLLFYSNNFLHKDLKTGPEKGPRIKRMGGKKQLARKALRPISELPKEPCCPQRCVRFAQHRNKQVETWRKTAVASKQGVRKVVSDMLSSKDQTCCHKFITLVTGCSFSLISKVKEQQRKRSESNSNNSPEHVRLKNNRQQYKKRKIKEEVSHYEVEDIDTSELEPMNVTDNEVMNGFNENQEHHNNDLMHSPTHNLHTPNHNLHTPNHNLLTPNHNLHTPNHNLHTPNTLLTPNHNLHTPNHALHTPSHNLHTPNLHIPQPISHSTLHDVSFQLDQSAFSHYLQSRAEFWQPLALDCPSQTLQAITPSQLTNLSDHGESPPQSQTFTVLGPAATSPTTYANHPQSSVIINMPEVMQSQAISVISSPSSLEPLTSSPFGNVVIFPESTIYVPNHSLTGIL